MWARHALNHAAVRATRRRHIDPESKNLFYRYCTGGLLNYMISNCAYGVAQRLRGQDEVGRWSVQCPRRLKFKNFEA